MAKPLPIAAFRGGNKSLTLNGKAFPIGPQITAFKKPDGSGAITLSTPDMVFEGFDCRGRDIVIDADNVKVRNCLINATSWYALNNNGARKGFVAEFNLLDGEKADNQNAAMLSSEGADSIVRNNIVLYAPTDMLIMCGGLCEHNVFAGSFYQTGAHADAFSIGKSNGPMVFRENYIDFTVQPDGKGNANSCIKVVSHFGPIDDVLIDGNILLGGGYNMYCGPAQDTPHPVNNVRVVNNLYGLSYYGGGTPDGFIVGGGVSPANGTNFVNSGNQQFASAPDSVVAIGAVAPTPAPSPIPTPAPIPPPVNPVCIVKPTIEGGRKVGEKAVTASGTWKDAKPDWSFVWAWALDGKLIDGAKSWEYTPAAPGQLVVAVAVTTPAGGKTIVTSDPVTVAPAVAPAPTPVPTPNPAPTPVPAPAPAPVVDAALRKAVTDAAATLENLAYSLRQLAK